MIRISCSGCRASIYGLDDGVGSELDSSWLADGFEREVERQFGIPAIRTARSGLLVQDPAKSPRR
jgi:hypothetical protein